MKNKFFKKILLASGIMLIMSPEAMATGEFIENDVTPPWGSLSIVGATEYNNVSYVEGQNVKVQLYANDDKCEDTEIKYYISTSAIPDNAKIETWYDYAPGKTHDVTLPSTTAVNTIYAVFKDKNGNTSLIFSNTSQNVVYNLNAADATMQSVVSTTRLYGAPFMITNQTPTREGYYFKGWGLNSTDTIPSYYAEDVIYPDESVGDGDTLTFYAIWTTETEGLPLLADVAQVGDYVNYPVGYENVVTRGTLNKSTYKGWRVISKDVDIDRNLSEGTVNLVSAGVPLTYYHTGNPMAASPTGSVANLAINFLETSFSTGYVVGFRKKGFSSNQTLTSIFTNKYTATYESDTTVTYPTDSSNTVSATKLAGTLKVRAMVAEDIYEITGATSMSSVSGLSNAKYQKLFATGGDYWLASAYSNSFLWFVYDYGSVHYNDGSFKQENGVRPVVSLKPEVRVTGRDATGAWNIEI